MTPKILDFLSLLASGDFASAEENFSAQLQAALPTSALKKWWLGMGTFKSIQGYKGTLSGLSVVTTVFVDFDSGPRGVSVTFLAPALQITGLSTVVVGDLGGYTYFAAGAECSECVAACAALVNCTQPFEGVTLTDVSFPSAVVSGHLTLRGTIVAPSSYSKMPSGSIPGVVLITGSGPNNRWGGQGQNLIRPYLDISLELARKGFAVITYDKRSCFKSDLTCYYVPCSTANQTNCVDLASVSLGQFISDAQSALEFLKTFSFVNGSNLASIGHSQGCLLAPYVGDKVEGVRAVVLLMGAGVSVPDLYAFQAQQQIPVDEYSLAKTEKSDPDLYAYINGTLFAAECTAKYAQEQGALLNDPTFMSDPTALLCLSGSFWGPYTAGYVPGLYPTGVVCPASCGTCVASNPTCYNASDPMSPCMIGRAVGDCTSPQFFGDWNKYSQPEALISSLSNVKGRILSINSWTDLLVTPKVYGPLHDILQTELAGTSHYVGSGTEGTVTEVSIRIFANLTHEMTQYLNGSDIHVQPQVLATVSSFLLNGNPRQQNVIPFPASPSPTSAPILDVGYSSTVVIALGITCGALFMVAVGLGAALYSQRREKRGKYGMPLN